MPPIEAAGHDGVETLRAVDDRQRLYSQGEPSPCVRSAVSPVLCSVSRQRQANGRCCILVSVGLLRHPTPPEIDHVMRRRSQHHHSHYLRPHARWCRTVHRRRMPVCPVALAPALETNLDRAADSMVTGSPTSSSINNSIATTTVADLIFPSLKPEHSQAVYATLSSRNGPSLLPKMVVLRRLAQRTLMIQISTAVLVEFPLTWDRNSTPTPKNSGPALSRRLSTLTTSKAPALAVSARTPTQYQYVAQRFVAHPLPSLPSNLFHVYSCCSAETTSTTSFGSTKGSVSHGIQDERSVAAAYKSTSHNAALRLACNLSCSSFLGSSSKGS